MKHSWNLNIPPIVTKIVKSATYCVLDRAFQFVVHFDTKWSWIVTWNVIYPIPDFVFSSTGIKNRRSVEHEFWICGIGFPHRCHWNTNKLLIDLVEIWNHVFFSGIRLHNIGKYFLEILNWFFINLSLINYFYICNLFHWINYMISLIWLIHNSYTYI